MSADNGIYILETEGPEYRVAHLQAIENYLWDDEIHELTSSPDVHIKNARDMWKGSGAFKTEEDAVKRAVKIYKVMVEDDFCPIVEYGIQFIKIPRRF